MYYTETCKKKKKEIDFVIQRKEKNQLFEIKFNKKKKKCASYYEQ